MTTQNPRADSDRQHQNLREQLPWYVNQTLSEAERIEVENHVASCPDCQADLMTWRQLATAVQDVDAPIPAPRADQFAMLMSQIDAAESSPPPPSSWWRALRERVDAWLPVWDATPTFARLAIAAQALVIVVLGGLAIWRAQPPPLYQTLSSEIASQAPRGRIQLIFAPQTTAQQMQRLLTAAQASIVAGPSPMGVYTIEIALPAKTPEALTAALETWRAHPEIELVEPVASP